MADSGPKPSSFLNRTGGHAGGITLAKASNPVNWGRLGKTVIGGGITMSFAGVFGVLSNLTQIAISPLQTATARISGIITLVGDGASTALSNGATATASSLTGFPAVVVWPLGVAIVLAGVYVAARGAQAMGLGGSV